MAGMPSMQLPPWALAQIVRKVAEEKLSIMFTYPPGESKELDTLFERLDMSLEDGPARMMIARRMAPPAPCHILVCFFQLSPDSLMALAATCEAWRQIVLDAVGDHPFVRMQPIRAHSPPRMIRAQRLYKPHWVVPLHDVHIVRYARARRARPSPTVVSQQLLPNSGESS